MALAIVVGVWNLEPAAWKIVVIIVQQFLLIAMGMKAATSNNSCIWCKVHKNERWMRTPSNNIDQSNSINSTMNLMQWITVIFHSCNMSHLCDYFLAANMLRTLDRSWSSQPGCHSQPLFNIGPENVVLDELHYMLRITDWLEHGIISDVVQWDEVNHKSWSEQSHWAVKRVRQIIGSFHEIDERSVCLNNNKSKNTFTGLLSNFIWCFYSQVERVHSPNV